MKDVLKAKINEQNSILNLAVEENRAMNEEEQGKFDNLETEIKNLEKTIEAKAKLEAREVENKTPVTKPIITEVKDREAEKPFKNLGEQLKAVRDAAQFGKIDKRLLNINNAATGMNESIPDEGGFAVQSDFAGMMMETAAKSGDILPLVDRFEISGNSNRVNWVDVDETSVATTVYGGVQTYWAAEAGTVTASKPKLIEKKMELEKLMGIAYATYELENDSNFLSQLYTRAFTTAIQREMENAVINGIGAGKPLGILKGGNLVTVAKESGQTADTIVYENIVKMYNRALDKSKNVWLVHPDAQEQLDFLEFPVGVGKLCRCA